MLFHLSKPFTYSIVSCNSEKNKTQNVIERIKKFAER